MSRHTQFSIPPAKLYYLIVLLCLGISNIYAQIPIASFTQNINGACVPVTVSFTNTSVNATSYLWDFGNGNTSTLQSPMNVYLVAGVYNIKLIAANAGGVSDTLVIVGAVNAIEQPVAGYYAQNTSSCLDSNSTSFVNTTQQSTYWLWDFGDGYTSTAKNPVHSYDFPGNYGVTLIAGNADSCENLISKPGYITIYQDWDATVSASDTNVCDVTNIFHFSSPTPGVVSWDWDFGDGIHSNLPNPSHTYVLPGVYTITLSTSDANGCSDIKVMQDMVTINSGNPGVISSSTASGCNPLVVSFADSSAATLSCLWDFGDGGTDTSRFSTHTYTVSGVYDVNITVTNITGCTVTTVLPGLVNVQARPEAKFMVLTSGSCTNLSAHFLNQSLMTSSWVWDFGDGTSSTQQSPTHVYSLPGNYSVRLQAFANSGCGDTVINTFQALNNMMNPIAKFSVDKEGG